MPLTPLKPMPTAANYLDNRTIEDDLAQAQRVFTIEIEGLKALSAQLGESFSAAITLLTETKGRVVVTGMGKSGHVGRKIAATIASTGTPAQFIHPAEASHGDLGMLSEKDTVLMLSNSGGNREISDIITYTRRFSIPLIGMTSKAESALGRNCDILLQIPAHTEACPHRLAPTTSTTMMVVLGDALALTLMQRKGFSPDEYSLRHPGGKLGAQFVRIQDIMHVDHLPLTSKDIQMDAAIDILKETNLSCLIVTDAEGKLAGVFTDGDVKRKLGPNFFNAKLADMMSANPKSMHQNDMAVKALKFMNDKRITALIIVNDANEPVGLLQIRQCLEAGLA